MSEFSGNLTPKQGLRIAIVVARFNEMITCSLLDGAQECFRRYGMDEDQVDVVWVPGAFELPIAAKRCADSGRYDAVICLGAVIRGATTHYDYVAGQSAAGIQNVSLSSDLPVIFGVLTTETIEQAIERAGTKAGNKGFDAAMAAIEMVNLLETLPRPVEAHS